VEVEYALAHSILYPESSSNSAADAHRTDGDGLVENELEIRGKQKSYSQPVHKYESTVLTKFK
jgi:hypothetical protein